MSGTASIAPAGETLWRGNTRRQIDQTMQVVEAILASRGYALADLNRAIAYFKHGADAPLFAEWCAARGVSIPFVPIECDICRDDLLFEIEADAFKLKG
jgi:enamine deaminase RidA (YjgF/YER057c/UK114 family)